MTPKTISIQVADRDRLSLEMEIDGRPSYYHLNEPLDWKNVGVIDDMVREAYRTGYEQAMRDVLNAD